MHTVRSNSFLCTEKRTHSLINGQRKCQKVSERYFTFCKKIDFWKGRAYNFDMYFWTLPLNKPFRRGQKQGVYLFTPFWRPFWAKTPSLLGSGGQKNTFFKKCEVKLPFKMVTFLGWPPSLWGSRPQKRVQIDYPKVKSLSGSENPANPDKATLGDSVQEAPKTPQNRGFSRFRL